MDGGVGIRGIDGVEGCDADGVVGIDCDGVDGDDCEEEDDCDGDDCDGRDGCDWGRCCDWLWLGEERWLEGICADGICGICGIWGMGGGVIGDWQAVSAHAPTTAMAAARGKPNRARTLPAWPHGRFARSLMATPRLSESPPSASYCIRRPYRPQVPVVGATPCGRPCRQPRPPVAQHGRGQAPPHDRRSYASLVSLCSDSDVAFPSDGRSKYSNSYTMRMSSLGSGPTSSNTGR